jgi:hypothetical protein
MSTMPVLFASCCPQCFETSRANLSFDPKKPLIRDAAGHTPGGKNDPRPFTLVWYIQSFTIIITFLSQAKQKNQQSFKNDVLFKRLQFFCTTLKAYSYMQYNDKNYKPINQIIKMQQNNTKQPKYE